MNRRGLCEGKLYCRIKGPFDENILCGKVDKFICGNSSFIREEVVDVTVLVCEPCGVALDTTVHAAIEVE